MLGTIKILKDEWKDKYLKICEQNIFSVDKRLVNGVLVLHLKNNVSPVLNDNNNHEEKYISSSDISCRPASVRRARFKRKPAIRSGSKSLSVENTEKRKQSFQFMLLKDELERYEDMSRLEYTNSNYPSSDNSEECDHERLEEDHLYEEISARNEVDDTYLIPVDSLKRTESFLTERRKQSQSWDEEVLSETDSIVGELGTSRTNSTSSTLHYSQEPIYIELDFDMKKLINRLVNSVKDEDFDESYDEQLKKLQHYTDVAIKRIESSRNSRSNKSDIDSTNSQELTNSNEREETRPDRPESYYSLPRNAELLENYTDENGDITSENFKLNKDSKVEISFDVDTGHYEHLPSNTDSLHILQPKTLQEEEKKYREIVEIKQSPRSSIIEKTEMKQSPSSSPKQSRRDTNREQVHISESPKHSPKNSPKQLRSNSPMEYWDLRKSDRQDRVNSFSSVSSKGSRDSCEIRI